MKILVTGGAGFIGSHLSERLLQDGHSVKVLDNFDNYYSPELKQENIRKCLENFNFELITGDVRNKETVQNAIEGVGAVVHEAAQAGVRASVEDPEKTVSVNIDGTLNVLVAAREARVKKIVFASSSSVYGKTKYLPYDEKHPTEPISPYGVTKLAGEHMCRVFSGLYGMEIPMLRYFTVYGPRVRPDLAINKFFRRAMKNEKIEIYGDGSKTRDFTYVGDIVEGTLLALEKGKTGPYNLGGGNRVSVKELAEKIIQITGSSSEVVYTENQAGDVIDTLSNASKAREELGWEPKMKIDEGLRNYYEWVKGRE
ncbi:SDR family NAD(P)-dependent oxidoreductase [Candidatus Micrarchaeota archaeon]|nr:SDR family NAD(P)-dependent oxidoreductase [Candidatus Micrarchaeota archaeon]